MYTNKNGCPLRGSRSCCYTDDMKKQRTGFTLIELLVVIAIIGTLSSIVLSSVSTARLKGSDAAIKQQLFDMHAAAENDYVDDSPTRATSDYYQACAPTSQSGQIFRNAAAMSDRTIGSALCVGPGAVMSYSADGNGNIVQAVSNPGLIPDKWAASVKLRTGGYYCVDSRGSSTTTPAMSISIIDYLCGVGTGDITLPLM
jgi:prepilin-type N-terminal cleavage/methylation domain-containing protein